MLPDRTHYLTRPTGPRRRSPSSRTALPRRFCFLEHDYYSQRENGAEACRQREPDRGLGERASARARQCYKQSYLVVITPP